MQNKISIMWKHFIKAMLLVVVVMLLTAAGVLAATGTTDSSTAPGSTNSYTLEDIYQAVSSNSAHDAQSQIAFSEPSSGPATGTMHSIDEIMMKLIGQVPKTGQTKCYNTAGTEISCAGTGQDGELRKGSLPVFKPYMINSMEGRAYTISEWEDPRFTDNGNGTVTDNMTGLIWLKDASCGDLQGTDQFGRAYWGTAINAANRLANGTCGLSDGSQAGDWRLPNVNELYSLVARAQPGSRKLPAGHPFTDPWSSNWTSTTSSSFTGAAWIVMFENGNARVITKDLVPYMVWPVRGGN